MTQVAQFRWAHVMATALIPALLYATGVGAILPVLPLIARDLGQPHFSDPSVVLAVAGVVTALLMVGELIGYLPSGWIVNKVGERNAMIGASVLSIIGLVACLLSNTPWLTGIGVFFIGLATAVFSLARHAFITTYVPITYRARVLAAVGGIFRFGNFAGPFITVAMLAIFVTLESAYWIHLVMCVAAIIVLLAAKDPASMIADNDKAAGTTPARRRPAGLFRTIASRRDILLRLGTPAAIISALRAGRIVLIPLWAVSIGLDDVTTATIIAIAGGVDFALFYVGGWIIDKVGRLWNALPSTLGIALALIMLAFTSGMSHAVAWFIVLTMIMAVANGLGTGILLTLGADFADPQDPAPFLGAWRFTSGLGNAASPLIVSALTAAVSLPFAVGALGVSGVIGAAMLVRYIPRYLPGDTLRRRRQ